MKIWMLLFSYLPMVINLIITPIEELKWAWPAYFYTAMAIILAMLVLKLMTWSDNVDRRAVVACNESIASSCHRPAADAARQNAGKVVDNRSQFPIYST